MIVFEVQGLCSVEACGCCCCDGCCEEGKCSCSGSLEVAWVADVCWEEVGGGELRGVDGGAVRCADDDVRFWARGVGCVATAFALQVAEGEKGVFEVRAPERCGDFWG